MELIDASNAQGRVDWHAVYKAGIRGVWLKATEGVTYDDWWFATNRRRANAAGLRVGAYHFARPDRNSPLREAEHFCRAVGKIGRRDLRPVLDLERENYLRKYGLESWARLFNRSVRRNLGALPAFYSYPAYIAANLDLSEPIGNGLWLAAYGPNDGKRHPVTIPAPWRAYIAHQYTSKGRVPGVNGYVDRSYAPRLRGVLAHPVLGLL